METQHQKIALQEKKMLEICCIRIIKCTVILNPTANLGGLFVPGGLLGWGCWSRGFQFLNWHASWKGWFWAVGLNAFLVLNIYPKKKKIQDTITNNVKILLYFFSCKMFHFEGLIENKKQKKGL